MRSKTGNTPETELSRRKFLGAGLALSAGALALPAHAFPAVHTPAIRAAGNATSSTSSSAPDFELEEITVAQLQDAMASGKWTARSIAEKYLARISEIDTHGPALNSVIELNPEALAIADSLDAERKSKGPRGPMHGIPVLIKDNIGTSDRMMTSAGSLALSGNIPPKDSGVARQLRAAGAVILGKTNLSEWANFRSSHSSSGWSGRGGQTRNPYALDRNPCGSSSGSGAAVSANLCAVTVGSETDGSIVCPSSANGVVGIKPTVG
ncbi:MAG: amidase family protein, partial [Candidatus Acidiferrales bacterium]